MPAHDRPFVTERRVSLDVIDEAVATRFGPARVPGNAQPAAFNRQVAMYLAKHVGGWSTTRIGKFYNGRDHSTVCHSIRRIEVMREENPELDGQLSAIASELRSHVSTARAAAPEQYPDDHVLDALVERIVNRLLDRLSGAQFRHGQFSR